MDHFLWTACGSSFLDDLVIELITVRFSQRRRATNIKSLPTVSVTESYFKEIMFRCENCARVREKMSGWPVRSWRFDGGERSGVGSGDSAKRPLRQSYLFYLPGKLAVVIAACSAADGARNVIRRCGQ